MRHAGDKRDNPVTNNKKNNILLAVTIEIPIFAEIWTVSYARTLYISYI